MDASDFFHSSYLRAANLPLTSPEKRHSDSKPAGGGDHFIIEDLFDFSNEDPHHVFNDDCTFDTITGNSTDSSTTVTAVDSCNSSANLPRPHLPDDLSLPRYDDFPDLELFSRLEEESFSSEDLQKLQLISGMKTVSHSESTITPDDDDDDDDDDNNNNINSNNQNNQIFRPEQMVVPGKARSKRSRAAPCDWSSRLVISPTATTPTSSSSESDVVAADESSVMKKKTATMVRMKKKEGGADGCVGGEGRKCLHCATEKTPQWRTGPMGPKTLCNACGVRYKSGRLVPEYRPAASPTFVLTKHSNSHRKVLELRRQKEMQQHHQQPVQFLYPSNAAAAMFELSNDDQYLIHHHTGPDFRQLI